MKRIVAVAWMVLGIGASWAAAGETNLGCKTHCTVPPPPREPDCAACSCNHRLCLCVFPESHTRELIEQSACDEFCKRVSAVKKLGCRWHADYCRDGAVLDALLRALQCDSCWEVRRGAAWSLMQQNARTNATVLALYLASKLDPHYLVRTRASEALDILTVGKQECYEELYKAADALIGVLRARGYRPGRDCCAITSATALSPEGGLSIATTLPATPSEGETPSDESDKAPVEKLPAPKSK